MTTSPLEDAFAALRPHVGGIMAAKRAKNSPAYVPRVAEPSPLPAPLPADQQARAAQQFAEYGEHAELAAELYSEVAQPEWTEPDQPELRHSGQLRMAHRLASYAADRLLHVAGVGWHHWTGERWARDDLGHTTRTLVEVLRLSLEEAEAKRDQQLARDVRKCESATGARGTLEFAAALPEFACAAADLDADPWLLNVANGTLDLRTMRLHAHDPRDRITKLCGAAYHPGITAPAWGDFLARVLPETGVRDYLQRLVGVALLGKVEQHVLPILTGTGSNGKSTAINAICGALGDYASTAEPDLIMHRDGAHPTGEMDLMGRRFVAIAESDEGRKLAQATMKRLTGGDPIKARYMRQDFIEFMPSHLAVLVTNHLPKVSGDDPAIWRRIRVIPFNVVVPAGERDPQLPDRLAAEADAILTWAIAGYAAYVAAGNQLGEPDSVLVATDRYREKSDLIAAFIRDACEEGENLRVSAAALHAAFKSWGGIDARQVTPPEFKAGMERLGYTQKKTAAGKVWAGLMVADDDHHHAT